MKRGDNDNDEDDVVDDDDDEEGSDDRPKAQPLNSNLHLGHRVSDLEDLDIAGYDENNNTNNNSSNTDLLLDNSSYEVRSEMMF